MTPWLLDDRHDLQNHCVGTVGPSQYDLQCRRGGSADQPLPRPLSSAPCVVHCVCMCVSFICHVCLSCVQASVHQQPPPHQHSALVQHPLVLASPQALAPLRPPLQPSVAAPSAALHPHHPPSAAGTRSAAPRRRRRPSAAARSAAASSAGPRRRHRRRPVALVCLAAVLRLRVVVPLVKAVASEHLRRPLHLLQVRGRACITFCRADHYKDSAEFQLGLVLLLFVFRFRCMWVWVCLCV